MASHQSDGSRRLVTAMADEAFQIGLISLRLLCLSPPPSIGRLAARTVAMARAQWSGRSHQILRASQSPPARQPLLPCIRIANFPGAFVYLQRLDAGSFRAMRWGLY